MSVNGINTNPYQMQYGPKKLDTASELVGYDIEKYVFDDTFEKKQGNITNPIQPTDEFSSTGVKKDQRTGILLLGALTLGAALIIKGKGGLKIPDFIKKHFTKP